MPSHFSHVQLFATLRTVDNQAPLSMGFSRHVYWSELSFPSPGDLPDPGIELRSPALQADALTSEPLGKPFMTTGKTITLTRWTFDGKVMSLLLNMLSRLVMVAQMVKHLPAMWET